MFETSLPSHPIDVVSSSSESTVISEFIPEANTSSEYQSEAALENELIETLRAQAYEYLPITTAEDLVLNLRHQLERLNNIQFSDNEWDTFYSHVISSKTARIEDKTRLIQEEHIQLLTRDDGTVKNIWLIDKDNIHNNHLQVINQYEASGNHDNRYDVTILVNGLPLVHIELKKRGRPIKEAFNQIDRYQRDSFWSETGLYEFVQLFVISNGTNTKYYSNTTRMQHIVERNGKRRGVKTSHSFEFTSYWTDATNRRIQDLIAFAKTFLAKHAILNILTKYCVFNVDEQLLVMRPYQIVATERIMERINVATNNKWLGTTRAGGYIWHTTGSGKTLTSFKTAQLASKRDDIDKVLFVVDRKDLDYQTMKEYNKFQKDAVTASTSTRVLKNNLEDSSQHIIVTTIQKLSTFIKKNAGHTIYSKHIVIIFDECHRSQFGDMHKAITKAFKNYHLFGFTGTPIFAENASTSGHFDLLTTEQAFGDKLHTYTIVDAIHDDNVLPFRIDYINTIAERGDVPNKDVYGILTEEALLDDERIGGIVDYILEHFDQKTKRNESYELEARRVMGFNSILATASIEAARKYYGTFQIKQRDLPSDKQLKVGLIYSFTPNEEEIGGFIDEEGFETERLSGNSRDFLEDAIQDYNQMFGTSFDTSSEKFQNYYKDLSLRIKNREIDLVIVVNMFLTGFDATTLNTLWVDKNLRSHGLIQAFSRTNRILNSVKTYGNIVCFRNLEDATNDALALFGNKDASGIVLLKPFDDYMSEYQKLIEKLLSDYDPQVEIIGVENEKLYIKLFSQILRLRNILTSFDEFESLDPISPRQLQDYQSVYLDLYDKHHHRDKEEKESIIDDVVFEIELVKQVEITVDYILMRVEKYREEFGNGEDKEIRASLIRDIDASPTLRKKKDLVENFIDTISLTEPVDGQWEEFIEQKMAEELNQIITEEDLKPTQTVTFMDNAFRDGQVVESGTAIVSILPAMSRFSPDAGHAEKKQKVVDKLKEFFERFYGLLPKRNS